jgi:predicted phage gp36 major capsid-like protein
VAILGLSVAVKVQSSRLDACKQEFSAFQADVKSKGEAAQRESDRINQENAKRKEKSDAERKRLIIANNGLADRLRDNAARSSLPEASGNTGIPETACFRRADLDAAIQRFTTGIAGIVTQGDSAVTDLDNAKRWAEK